MLNIFKSIDVEKMGKSSFIEINHVNEYKKWTKIIDEMSYEKACQSNIFGKLKVIRNARKLEFKELCSMIDVIQRHLRLVLGMDSFYFLFSAAGKEDDTWTGKERNIKERTISAGGSNITFRNKMTAKIWAGVNESKMDEREKADLKRAVYFLKKQNALSPVGFVTGMIKLYNLNKFEGLNYRDAIHFLLLNDEPFKGADELSYASKKHQKLFRTMNLLGFKAMRNEVNIMSKESYFIEVLLLGSKKLKPSTFVSFVSEISYHKHRLSNPKMLILLKNLINHLSKEKSIERIKKARIHSVMDFLFGYGSVSLRDETLTDWQIKQPLDYFLNLEAERLVKARKVTENTSFIVPEVSFSKQDAEVKLLKSSTELFIEGETLSHCVGGYSRSVASGQSQILSIKRQGLVTKADLFNSTVEFTFCDKGWKIVQHRAGFNNDPLKEAKKIAKDFLAELQKKYPNGFNPISFKEI